MKTQTEKLADSWTVVLCYPDHHMYQHNFLLTERAAVRLGTDRAEYDAKKFAEDFQVVATVLYCGPTDRMSEHLKQDLAEDRYC